MLRLPTIGLACLALAFVAGCGDNESDSSSSSPPPSTETAAAAASGQAVEVKMKDIKFVPHDISVKVGQKIVWTNDDSVPHNVTATGGADFASKTVNTGQTYEFTPTKAGTIDYVCTIHSGQDGQITVTK